MTRDNVTLKVNAVVYFRIKYPTKKARHRDRELFIRRRRSFRRPRCVAHFRRSGAGRDATQLQREKLNVRLQAVLDEHTGPWGVKVSMVEIKQVDLPESMIRAIARQAEAERERRAKIIHAEGEAAAAQKVSEKAAAIMSAQPSARCSFATCRRWLR